MWLAKRAVELHRTWDKCGLQGLHQIWFAKHRPKNDRERGLDLTSGASEAYPEGVPSESESRLEIGAGERLALPGCAVSADPAMAALVAGVVRPLRRVK
jgi:hypothetical protein